VTPARYKRDGLTVDAVGATSYMVTTRSGTRIPVTVPKDEIVTGESTCFGDSGGPLFDAKGAVIGVTSRGIDAECMDRPSIFSDVFSHTQLVLTAAKAAGHALAGPSADAGAPLGDQASPGGDVKEAKPPSPKKADDADAPADPPANEQAAPPAAASCSAAGARAPSSAAWIGWLMFALVAGRRRKRPR
jgi:MYXO-CTERM domain-containing protein